MWCFWIVRTIIFSSNYISLDINITLNLLLSIRLCQKLFVSVISLVFGISWDSPIYVIKILGTFILNIWQRLIFFFIFILLIKCLSILFLILIIYWFQRRENGFKVSLIVLIYGLIWVLCTYSVSFLVFISILLEECRRIVTNFLKNPFLFLPVDLPITHIIMRSFILQSPEQWFILICDSLNLSLPHASVQWSRPLLLTRLVSTTAVIIDIIALRHIQFLRKTHGYRVSTH